MASVKPPPNPEVTGHSEFVKFAGMAIGVSTLAVLADMSELIGKLAVVVMSGWFLIFLITNAEDIQKLTAKV